MFIIISYNYKQLSKLELWKSYFPEPTKRDIVAICKSRKICENLFSGTRSSHSTLMRIGPFPGPRFNIKMSSYQYRKSHCGDKTVVRSSYLHNGISFTGKMASLYWFSPLVTTSRGTAITMVRLWGKGSYIANENVINICGENQDHLTLPFCDLDKWWLFCKNNFQYPAIFTQ